MTVVRAAALSALTLACAPFAPSIAGCAPEPREPVMVIGHRGAPLVAIENSIESFRAAKAQGADGVELDVALTADGVDVVMHDELLDRTTTCTGAVRDRTVEGLGGCRLKNGEPVRTLEAVLAEIGPEFRLIFVELKVFDGRAVAQADDVVAQVLRSGHAAKVVASSYDATANIRLAARQSEGIIAGWDATTNEALSRATEHGARWALMPFRALGGREGDLARGTGKELAVYVVASAADFAWAYDAGVRVMMTDTVPLLRAVVAGD
ncbi:MAG: hypothetical protein HYV09_33355 [Deltaproteobacteria bacterium]|nr:hypothetical protein [Deltaproteobacteria bacterium]